MLRYLTVTPLFFFFNDTATTEIYTLSLHDALPIYQDVRRRLRECGGHRFTGAPPAARERVAASSTRTTRTPSSAPARGGSAPRATRTKCPSSAASGSMFGVLGMKMSPSRIARVSPYEPYSGGRSAPLS